MEKKAPIKTAALFFALWFVATGEVQADTIRLLNGETLIGKVSGQSGSSITMFVDGKQKTIMKRDIRIINYGDADKALMIQQKTKELALRKKKLAEAQKMAQARMDEQKEKEEDDKNIAALLDTIEDLKKETAKLEEELLLAKQEAETIKSERSNEIQKDSGQRMEEWIVQKSVSLSMGNYRWLSSAMNIAFQLDVSRTLNLAMAGWIQGKVSVINPESKIGFGDSLKLDYKSRSPSDGRTDEYGLFLASSEFDNAISRRSSYANYSYVDSISGSGATLSVAQSDSEYEFHQKPKVTHLDLHYRKHFEFFNNLENRFVQPITFHIGGALTGDGLKTSGSPAQNSRTVNVTPADPTAISLVSYGAGPRTGSLEYGQGVLSLDAGFSYALTFLNQHIADFRWNRRMGLYSGGNFENNGNTIFQIASYTLPIKVNSNGDFRFDYSGEDYELGYSYLYNDFKFRVFYYHENRSIKITETSLSNNYDWFYILSNLTNNNYIPMVALDFMDPMGPYPRSRDEIKGAGFQITYYY